jgi:hypothetical protein
MAPSFVGSMIVNANLQTCGRLHLLLLESSFHREKV